ncbi:MAG: alpha/beta fold hydrolase [Saccharofermentanales bacterium]|jgi:pimeloyl-ACP methyl ester carboxylesterase
MKIRHPEHPNLVFLPGLTADHRLFDKHIEYFESRRNGFVWDAPGDGFRILADAIEKDLKCPALLICGESDKISSVKRNNAAWQKEAQIHLHWIKDAGHNANTDQPEIVNKLIETFVKNLENKSV